MFAKDFINELTDKIHALGSPRAPWTEYNTLIENISAVAGVIVVDVRNCFTGVTKQIEIRSRQCIH